MSDISYDVIVLDRLLDEFLRPNREPDFSAHKDEILYEIWLEEKILSNIEDDHYAYGTFVTRPGTKHLKDIHPLDLAYMEYLATKAIEESVFDI
jgi:hypothetical protein